MLCESMGFAMFEMERAFIGKGRLKDKCYLKDLTFNVAKYLCPNNCFLNPRVIECERKHDDMKNLVEDYKLEGISIEKLPETVNDEDDYCQSGDKRSLRNLLEQLENLCWKHRRESKDKELHKSAMNKIYRQIEHGPNLPTVAAEISNMSKLDPENDEQLAKEHWLFVHDDNDESLTCATYILEQNIEIVNNQINDDKIWLPEIHKGKYVYPCNKGYCRVLCQCNLCSIQLPEEEIGNHKDHISHCQTCIVQCQEHHIDLQKNFNDTEDLHLPIHQGFYRNYGGKD